MDWTKYPLEKLFIFIAGVCPGIAAFVVLELSRPGTFNRFFTLPFLGYRTKLTILIIAAFVIGYTMTTFFRGILGAIGGVYGTWLIKKHPSPPSFEIQLGPWRDPRWRALLKRHLGSQSPADSMLMTAEVFKMRMEMAKYLPHHEQAAAVANLNLEKLNLEINDSQWSQWYDYYHEKVLQPEETDVLSHVRWGLNINLDTAALFILIGSYYIPNLRHWWVFVPTIVWLCLLAAEEYSILKKYTDPWSTLSAQAQFRHLIDAQRSRFRIALTTRPKTRR